MCLIFADTFAARSHLVRPAGVIAYDVDVAHPTNHSPAPRAPPITQLVFARIFTPLGGECRPAGQHFVQSISRFDGSICEYQQKTNSIASALSHRLFAVMVHTRSRSLTHSRRPRNLCRERFIDPRQFKCGLRGLVQMYSRSRMLVEQQGGT